MSVFYDLNKTPRNILNQAIVRAIVSENNGALFDPSDLSTLYQDAAGTTPVTAVEQPVGLMLDKARGMMLGSEIVSNGTFDTDASGWTAVLSTLSVSSGVIRVTNTAADYGFARQVINTVIGKMYEYKGVFVGGTGAYSLAVKIGTTNYSASAFASGIKFLATATTTTIQLNVGTNVIGAYMEFDSASLKELYGYHATQSITASRPTLSARYNVWQYTEDVASNRYSAQNATKQTDTLVYGGITLTRVSMTQFYSSIRSQVNGLGLTPFVVGQRYLLSFYAKSASEQFMWCRNIGSTSSQGHGAKLITATPRRLWILVQATDTSHVTPVTTASSTLGTEAGADPYWLVQGSTEGGAGEIYVGGFQIEPVSNSYTDGIALIGDSTMAGSSGFIDSVATTAREVSVWLGSGLNTNVFNRAIGGNKLSDMDARWTTDITPLKTNCKYAVIQGGINDIGQGSALASVQASMNSLVSKAVADGLIPVVFTCSPTTSIAANPAYEAIRVAFNAWILSTFTNTVDIATALADPANPSLLNPAWVGDGVHYSQAGKRVAGELAANATFWKFTKPSSYQYVRTTSDYDTDERYFPKYLRFDAVDDFTNLPFMNLYGGGSASIICARDCVSQATDTYIISERSTTDADPKYFPSRQLANAGNMDAYIADDAGAVVLDTVGSPFSGVANAVIRSIVDSGNNLKLFKNGTLAANDNYTRSGTLTLNTTTIGASVSTTTSNYASMKLYGLIITKSALTDAQRIACERYLGRKSGVQL